MSRLPGQAVRVAQTCVHLVARVALLLVVLAGVALGALAWRLAQGPIDIGWLARRLEDAANAGGGPTRLAIGSAALAWEGVSQGVDRPLDLRLTAITATEPGGRRLLDIPRAEVSLSIGALLTGRAVPRAIEVDGLRLRLLRAADGAMSLDLGSLAEGADASPDVANADATPWLAELVRPAQTDATAARSSPLAQLRRVRLRGAQITVVDRALGATWRMPDGEIDLRRRPGGGVEGSASLYLALGAQTAKLDASAALEAGGATRVRVRLTPLAPASLAAAAPALARLEMLDAPVTLAGEAELGPGLQWRRATVEATIAAGGVRVGGQTVALAGARLALDAEPSGLRLREGRLALIGKPSGATTTVTVTGTLRREGGLTGGGKIDATAALDLDRVAFADLGSLWPAGLPGGTRPWLVENVTAGSATRAHVAVSVSATGDLSDVALTDATGQLEGDDVTLAWLRPIPPVEHAGASLRIVDPDTIEIAVRGGRQAGGASSGGAAGGIVIQDGRIRFTGLAGRHQVAGMEFRLGGPVVDALAVLREPRLHLFDAHPLDLKDPSGDVAATLTLTLPLENDVTMDAVPIRAQGRLINVHVAGIAAGRDIDQANLDLDVGNDGLKLAGPAVVAGIASQLAVEMDFRSGPPTQILQKVTLTGRAEGPALAAAGLDGGGAITGAVGVQASLTERRDGQGDIIARADLKDAGLAIGALGWRKDPGGPGRAEAHVRLKNDKLASIDSVLAQAEGLDVAGHAEVAQGQASVLRLDRLSIGGTRAQGDVRLAAPGAPLSVSVIGSVLDLSARPTRQSPGRKPAEPDRPGPPWTADARFERAVLGEGRVLSGIVVHAENDGRVIRRGRLDGRTAAGAAFTLAVAPQAGGRSLTGTAADAGGLLRAFDIIRVMEGGKLALAAQYDDTQPDHPLSGTAEIDDFRIRGAPALAKLLQAMTLYGLVDVMSGPGLGFSKLTAPFRLTDDAIELADARAFSASLGLTVKGRVDLVAQQADLQGTIVPAYFFNSLLGNIPLVGRLFSPEQGGGLFAASYTIKGRLDDPSVSVNPLAALTPGFLRGVFGMFDSAPAK